MKVLLDECLPLGLRPHLISFGHECATVREAGFGSKKNGELLTLAEGKWDVLLTIDRNIKYQQNMGSRKISVLVIRSRSNRTEDLRPQLPACAEALARIQPGQIIEI
ncbi:MAG: DUF5615 family PIN-like protein [Candidatus Acidiferrum sp.]